ncbi:MAG: hypothetical protein ACLFV2_08305 [Desulfurivibrionaceae bacterium]
MKGSEEEKKYEQTEHPREPRHSPEQHHSLKRQEYFPGTGRQIEPFSTGPGEWPGLLLY